MKKISTLINAFAQLKSICGKSLLTLVSEDKNKMPTSTLKRVSMTTGILGAIAGDCIGAPYEFRATKSKDFNLLEYAIFTDDTVMTLAVAKWLMEDPKHSHEQLISIMQEMGRRYPTAGYGSSFFRWLYLKSPKPYNSCENGSGMRVSPCGFYAKSLKEALDLAKISAEVTHNHPEGIKGAQAIAAAIFLAREGQSKAYIREYISHNFGYDLSRSLDEIRQNYKYEILCQTSVPESILSYLEADTYEATIRNAVSLGGDADTMACMAGAIAAATPGMDMPIEIASHIKNKILDPYLQEILYEFNEFCNQ